MNQQVIGTVAGLEQRNGGWVAVSIMEPGSQYPKKLSTKKPELIQQAQQMMGQVVTAGYNESESTNINPHNGQPYMNRFLEALAFGAVDLVGQPTQIQPQQFMPQQPQQPPVQQPVMQQAPVQQQSFAPAPQGPPLPDLREQKIMRQAASKVAVQLLDHLDPPERTLASLVRISEQLVKYFDQGVPWDVAPVQAQAPQAPPPGDFQQQPGDDDFPF